jgi:organic hydroperoxide reductase OsmC/OhrA
MRYLILFRLIISIWVSYFDLKMFSIQSGTYQLTEAHAGCFTLAVSGVNAEEFMAITKDAEKNCIISKVLSTLISSEAHFIA